MAESSKDVRGLVVVLLRDNPTTRGLVVGLGFGWEQVFSAAWRRVPVRLQALRLPQGLKLGVRQLLFMQGREACSSLLRFRLLSLHRGNQTHPAKQLNN